MRRAALQLGDTVVVTGASGGVGIHTVKLARLLGLRCIAISSSPSKSARLCEAGAADVVVAPDLSVSSASSRVDRRGRRRLRDRDCRSADLLLRACDLLRREGGWSSLAMSIPATLRSIPRSQFSRKLISSAALMPRWPISRKVIDLVARGEIEPEIAAFVPAGEAARAHAMMEERATAGRVVLVHGGRRWT